MSERQPRERDRNYLAWLHTQPCCICGLVPVQAHHIRIGSIGIKRETGMAEKSSDKWALPLCRYHHDESHKMHEREFWASYGLDPFALSLHYHARPR